MKNSILTSKKLLVVVLTVILFAVCVTSSTFSWLTVGTTETTANKARPKASSTGGKLVFTLPQNEGGSAYELKAYSGESVTMTTEVSNDDGVHFYDKDHLPSGMPATSVLPYTSGTLGTTSPSNRIYYKTEITNGKTTPQNVSLYIKNFAPGGESGSNICVGTNQPVKSFKNYSMAGVTIPAPTKAKKDATTKRVYFDPWSSVQSGNNYDSHRSNWGSSTNHKDYWVCSGNNGTFDSKIKMTVITTTGTDAYKYYYADIPWGNNQLYLTCSNPNSTVQNYQRTQTFTDLYGDGLSTLQSLCFYTNGNYTSENNAWAGKYTCTGANVASHYGDVTISNVSGQSVNVALDSSWYSSDSSYGIKYASSDESIFTINETTGAIVPVAAGTAYIKYKVKSQFGETREYGSSSISKVTVKTVNTSTDTIKNAPIVTNLLIPAATTANQQNEDMSNVQVVYWFIQNGDPLYGPANASGTYTLNSIYLGL